MSFRLTDNELAQLGFSEHYTHNSLCVRTKDLGKGVSLVLHTTPLSYSKRSSDCPPAYTELEVEFLQQQERFQPKLPEPIVLKTHVSGALIVSAQDLLYIVALSTNTQYTFLKDAQN